MLPDFDRCYAAVQSKDPRFDGWFFTGVLTTGIYCRPSCPAITPKRANVRFFASAAAAHAAGLRACKRCRPDATPGSPEWNVRSDVTARAMRLIGDGVVDREGVAGLAGRLGYSSRQLQRHLVTELGAGPIALARAQRAQTARVLLETTELPVTEVAFAAGFGSVRQFNDTVRAVFALSPSELRSRRSDRVPVTGGLHLRLPYRPPLEADALLAHFAARAVAGVEEVAEGAYRRTLRLPHGPGVVRLRPEPDHVACTVLLTDVRDTATAVQRCRRIFDLDADPVAVDSHLGADASLEPLVRKRPGLRVPGSPEPTELAIRAVLGQQVSVAAARSLAGRLTAQFGTPLAEPIGGLTHLFPAPAALAAAPDLPMPASRAATIRHLATALADGTVALDVGVPWAEAEQQLLAVPGVGPWTAAYVRLRGLGDPDAFPATDLGLQRALATLDRPSPDQWAPWRAYAAQHLWTSLAEGM